MDPKMFQNLETNKQSLSLIGSVVSLKNQLQETHRFVDLLLGLYNQGFYWTALK